MHCPHLRQTFSRIAGGAFKRGPSHNKKIAGKRHVVPADELTVLREQGEDSVIRNHDGRVPKRKPGTNRFPGATVKKGKRETASSRLLPVVDLEASQYTARIQFTMITSFRWS